jgi:CubicO group peptidase (beta-lactamase class C family)/heat shock protein HslJ
MKAKTLFIALILCIFVLSVSGCSTANEEQPISMPEVALEGTSWTLETFVEGQVTSSLIDDAEITLQFGGGHVRGSAGCNDYGGAYTLERGALRIPRIDITKQLCLEPVGVMAQETRYLEILREMTVFIWDANHLTLKTANGPGLRFVSTEKTATVSQAGPTDPLELEAFVDGVIAAQLQAYHVPGATVSIVKDGEIYLAKGYGYADLEIPTPVSADRTLFRPGSVSKLFTWTAVMQLAEQGKVDLYADVNIYLRDIKIPNTYHQPVTLVHLLTHTAGFENRNEGLFVRQMEEIVPLRDYLVRYMPARIYPPGQITAYSNYGAALAGHIVEQVTGMPFEEYIDENIFKPLGMTRSTFARPLPTGSMTDLAIGYSYVDGAYQPETEWVQPAPAGGLTTTATDMARFMIVHLQNGHYGDGTILSASSIRKMHQRQFTNDPRANGWTFGFMEAELNEQRIIWHGGATYFFHSALVLLPEENVGVFISFNSVGGSVARQTFIQAFLNHYCPASHPVLPKPPVDSNQRIERYTGTYLETRHNEMGVEKLLSLQSAVTIAATEGTLKTVGIGFAWPESETARWIEVEPFVLRRMEGEGTLIFLTDEQGNTTGLIDKNDPQVVYEKQPWYETAAFHLSVLLTCWLVFLSAALGWPIGFVVGHLKRDISTRPAFLSHLCKWLGWSFSVLSLYFIVAFLGMMTDPEIVFRVPPALERLLTLPLILVVIAIGLIVSTVLVWARRHWGGFGRLYLTALTLAAIVSLWWLNHWNLLFHTLGPRY